MFKKKLKNKGQSTIEYIILVAGVIAVLLVFLAPNGVFNKAFDNTLKSGTDGMESMASKLNASHSSAPTTP